MKTKTLFLVLMIFVFAKTNAQWEPDVRLTNNPASSGVAQGSTGWCIASNNNDVHAVWYDNRDFDIEIYYKHSSDAGLTWGVDTRLTNSANESSHPSIALSGSTVHLAWVDYRDGNAEIYYKHSDDNGATWSADMRMSNNAALSYYGVLSSFGTMVHLVWWDDRSGNVEVYYRRSSDGGVTWGAETQLTNNVGDSYNPTVSSSASDVHIFWYDNRDGNNEIYYKRSTDGGLSWGMDTRLTNDADVSQYACGTVSGLNVHVVWADNRDGNDEIYYKRSTDGGVTWGADTRLTNNTAAQEHPNVNVSGSSVHAVWLDARDGTFGEVYYKNSSDGGTTWGVDTRLTNNAAKTWFPSVAVAGSVVHVVFQDERDGASGEIYYKRDPSGNIVGINELSLSENSFNIFPNPAKNNFTINTNTEFRSAQIEIFNTLGEIVYSEKNNTRAQTINCTSFSSGIYLVKINVGDKLFARKVIIQ